MASSPFTLQRFEHETSHLYYIPQKQYETITDEKSSYIIGSRGTGKTTLMHSLTWSERLHNESLHHQLDQDPFESKMIGVYVGVPTFSLKSIDAWLSETPEDIRCIVVSLYFELISLELISEALANLIAEDIVKSEPKSEYSFTKRMLNYSDKLTKFCKPKDHNLTLLSLAETFKSMRRALEDHSKKRTSAHDIVDIFPLDQIGAISNHFAKNINSLYPECKDEKYWKYKICFDETETLTLFNQKVINTLVRIRPESISYVVSYVRKVDDVTSTFLPNLTLGSADRHILYLEDMDELEFKDLAEGVSTVRVQKYTGSHDTKFNIDKIFGTIDINHILKIILKDSLTPFSKNLMKQAKMLMKSEFYKDSLKNKTKKNTETMPIYEAYLFDKLKLSAPSPGDSQWKKRSQNSREIRKKMVAAYLCICKELKGTKPKYAYSNMLLGMSCTCVRDYLLFVNEAYLTSGKDVIKFINSTLPISLQDKSFKNASSKKFNSIPSSSGISAPVRVSRLIDGLAQITEHIQTSGPNNIALRSSERGRFEIENTEDNSENDKLIRRLIRDAAEAGFLKTFVTKSNSIQFQVHHSLAAKYGFSYRGAYYTTLINTNDISSFVFPDNEKDVKSSLNRVKRKLAKDEYSKQVSLFEYIEESQ